MVEVSVRGVLTAGNMMAPGDRAEYWRLRLERALEGAQCASPFSCAPVEFRIACDGPLEIVFHVSRRDRTMSVQDGHGPPELRSTIVWIREDDLSTGHDWRVFGDSTPLEAIIEAVRRPVRKESWLSVRLRGRE